MFCDSFSRCATLCLSRDIGSRVSFLPPADTGEGAGGGLCLGEGVSLGVSLALGASFGASTVFGYDAALGAEGVYALGAEGAEDEAAGLGASGSTSKSGFPTPRLSPAFAWNLVMTPAAGLLISTVTLSVSMLATVSSSSTH